MAPVTAERRRRPTLKHCVLAGVLVASVVFAMAAAWGYRPGFETFGTLALPSLNVLADTEATSVPWLSTDENPKGPPSTTRAPPEAGGDRFVDTSHMHDAGAGTAIPTAAPTAVTGTFNPVNLQATGTAPATVTAGGLEPADHKLDGLGAINSQPPTSSHAASDSELDTVAVVQPTVIVTGKPAGKEDIGPGNHGDQDTGNERPPLLVELRPRYPAVSRFEPPYHDGRIANRSVVLVTAAITHRYDGAVLALQLAVPCWHRQLNGTVLTAAAALELVWPAGAAQAIRIDSWNEVVSLHHCLQDNTEYGEVHLLHVMELMVLAPYQVGARLQLATLHLMVSSAIDGNATAAAATPPLATPAPTRSPSAAVYTATFANEPVDVPLGMSLGSFKDMLDRHRALGLAALNTTLLPEMDMCFGPIYNTLPNPDKFARYLREYIELERSVGVHHMVFYVDLAALARQGTGTAFRCLIEACGREAAPVTFVDISELNERVDSWYHGQRLVVNDCLRRVAGLFRYVYVGDVDEIILPTKTATLPQTVARMLASPELASSTSYFFPVPAFLTWQPEVCDRLGPNDSFGEATERRNRLQSVTQRAQFFRINPWRFVTKTISMTAFVVSAREHHSVSIASTLPYYTGPATPDGQTLIEVGLVQAHVRGLSYQDEACKVWADDWLDNSTAIVDLRLQLPLVNIAAPRCTAGATETAAGSTQRHARGP